MSKATFLGIDGTARKVKKVYIGEDGVARQVRRAYVGVDGIAQIAFCDYHQFNTYVGGYDAWCTTGGESTYSCVCGQTTTYYTNELGHLRDCYNCETCLRCGVEGARKTTERVEPYEQDFNNMTFTHKIHYDCAVCGKKDISRTSDPQPCNYSTATGCCNNCGQEMAL